MKASTNKTSTKGFFIVAFVLFVQACSQTPKKPDTVENDDNAPQAIVYETFNAKSIAEKQYRLTDFVTNPNLENNPVVSKDIKKVFVRALEDIRADKLEEAESKLLPLHDNNPHLSGPAYNLALIKIKQGDVNDGIKYLDIALARNHYNFEARNLLGYIYRQKGDFLRAEKLWLENVTIWGGYAPSYKNLGILYDLYQGYPERAVGYYKQFNLLQKAPERLVTGWVTTIDRRIAANQKMKESQQAKAALAAPVIVENNKQEVQSVQ